MKQYGLIGYPLSHSFSKKYFAEKFQREHINDCSYENFPLTSIDGFVNLLKSHPQLRGLNVTIPYKQAVINFLDEMSEASEKIGAVNCIHINNGKLVGHNTDAIGFEESLVPLLNKEDKKALILGASGGAAKAAAYVMGKLHIPYSLVSRKTEQGYINYDKLTAELLKEYAIIINTTPLGMSPKIDEAPPIPYEALSKQHLLYDLIYNPQETLFLKKGKEKGARIKNGYEMLLLQAEASWDIWNK